MPISDFAGQVIDDKTIKPQVGWRVACWIDGQKGNHQGAGLGTIIKVDSDGETVFVGMKNGDRHTLKRHTGPVRPAMSWDIIV